MTSEHKLEQAKLLIEDVILEYQVPLSISVRDIRIKLTNEWHNEINHIKIKDPNLQDICKHEKFLAVQNLDDIMKLAGYFWNNEDMEYVFSF